MNVRRVLVLILLTAVLGLGGLLLFPLRFGAVRYEAAIINSATTRVSIADASAAKRAEAKLMRTATFPRGTSDARWARMTHSGKPGGCATPRP